MLMMDFVNGVTGTLATIRATPFYWRVHVFGTKGSAEVLDETTLILRRSGSKPKQHTYPAIDVLRAELDAFADAIEKQTARFRCRKPTCWRRCRRSKPRSLR